jgi:hypothetical protein
MLTPPHLEKKASKYYNDRESSLKFKALIPRLNKSSYRVILASEMEKGK